MLLQIQTVSAPSQSRFVHYGLLLLLSLFSLGVTWLTTWIVLITGTIAQSSVSSGFGAVLGAAIGFEIAAWMLRTSGWRTGSSANTMAAILLGGTALVSVFTDLSISAGSGVIVGAIVGAVGAAIVGIAMGITIGKLLANDIHKGIVISLSFLSVMLSVGLGLGITIGFSHPWLTTLLILSSCALGVLLLNLQLRQTNTALMKRKAERYLIKP